MTANQTTFNFGLNLGELPAHRHVNEDGTEGGWVADSAKVAEDAHIGYGSVVGPRCVIESGVRIGTHTKIGANVKIGAGTRIKDSCLVGSGVRLGTYVKLADCVTLEEKVKLESSAEVGMCSRLGPGCVVKKAKSLGSWTVVKAGTVFAPLWD